MIPISFVTWLKPTDNVYDSGKPHYLQWTVEGTGFTSQDVYFHYKNINDSWATIPVAITMEILPDDIQHVEWQASNIKSTEAFFEVQLVNEMGNIVARDSSNIFESTPHVYLTCSTLWGRTLVYNIFADGQQDGQQWSYEEKAYINWKITEALKWFKEQAPIVSGLPRFLGYLESVDLSEPITYGGIENEDDFVESLRNKFQNECPNDSEPYINLCAGQLLKYNHSYGSYSDWDNVVFLLHKRENGGMPWSSGPVRIVSDPSFIGSGPIHSTFSYSYSGISLKVKSGGFFENNPEAENTSYAHEMLHQFYALDEYRDGCYHMPEACIVWRNPFLNNFDYPFNLNFPNYPNKNGECCYHPGHQHDDRSLMAAEGTIYPIEYYNLSQWTQGWIGWGYDNTVEIWDIVRFGLGHVGGIVLDGNAPVYDCLVQIRKADDSYFCPQNISDTLAGTFQFRNLEPGDYVVTAIDGQRTAEASVTVEEGIEKRVVLQFNSVLRTGNNDLNALIPKEISTNSYPNPFNSETIISFDLPQNSDVKLEVYNLMGQRVETLVDGFREAGYHNVNWDASSYSSGIYFYNLSAGDRSLTKRMTILK